LEWLNALAIACQEAQVIRGMAACRHTPASRHALQFFRLEQLLENWIAGLLENWHTGLLE
jgi:hypothetical protein